MSEREIPEGFVAYRPERFAAEVVGQRARAHLEVMQQRRSVRSFAPDPVPRGVIEALIRTASTAPSGAHQQPWTWVAVSDAGLKRQIREAAEEEERSFYERRAPEAWREALAPLGTDWSKPYLEIAPWIVVAFEQTSGIDADGAPVKHYYVKESVGIACGLFVAAVHQAGLATLTHTPSPMGFLRELLGRPERERPVILFPVGYPAPDAVVPDLRRKALDEVAVFDPGV